MNHVRHQYGISRNRPSYRLLALSRSVSGVSLRGATTRRASAGSDQASSNHGRLPHPPRRLVPALSEPGQHVGRRSSVPIRSCQTCRATLDGSSQSMDITVHARSTNALWCSRLLPNGLLLRLDSYSVPSSACENPMRKPRNFSVVRSRPQSVTKVVPHSLAPNPSFKRTRLRRSA